MRLASRQMLLEPPGVLHRVALPVVVEVGEHFDLGTPRGDAPLPGFELALRVASLVTVPVVEADECPAGCQLAGLERALGVVADDERRSVPAKQLVHAVVKPARVAELEAVATPSQGSERALEPRVVAPEVVRELPQGGAQLARRSQAFERLVEAVDPAL